MFMSVTRACIKIEYASKLFLFLFMTYEEIFDVKPETTVIDLYFLAYCMKVFVDLSSKFYSLMIHKLLYYSPPIYNCCHISIWMNN